MPLAALCQRGSPRTTLRAQTHRCLRPRRQRARTSPALWAARARPHTPAPDRQRCPERAQARARRTLSARRATAQVPHDQPARGGRPGRRARRGGQAALPGPAPRDEHPRLPVRLVPRRAVRGRAPRQRGGLCRLRLLHALHEPAAGQRAPLRPSMPNLIQVLVKRCCVRARQRRALGAALAGAREGVQACRQRGMRDMMRLQAAWHVG